MTFSIIARCPQTGRLGLGIATFSIGAGGRCEGILAGVGICKTQAYTNRGNDPLAIELLAQGLGPAHVMQMLEQNDPDHAYRQIAIIDRDGNGVAHTGSGTRPWSGHKIGDGLRRLRQRAGGAAGDRGHRRRLHGEAGATRWSCGSWRRSKAAAIPAARSARRAISPSGRRRSAWWPIPTIPTSTSGSTCTTTPSSSCAACWRSSSATRSSIATADAIRRPP